MERSEEELSKMHWKERWEYEAGRVHRELSALDEETLLRRIENGHDDGYFQIWHVIGEKGTVEHAAPVLWQYLKDHPGEGYMLPRYHCAAALFQILGMPDPECKNELRCRVQWDHDGEEERQKALRELKSLIHRGITE
jgi:hypothetical protein